MTEAERADGWEGGVSASVVREQRPFQWPSNTTQSTTQSRQAWDGSFFKRSQVVRGDLGVVLGAGAGATTVLGTVDFGLRGGRGQCSGRGCGGRNNSRGGVGYELRSTGAIASIAAAEACWAPTTHGTKAAPTRCSPPREQSQRTPVVPQPARCPPAIPLSSLSGRGPGERSAVAQWRWRRHSWGNPVRALSGHALASSLQLPPLPLDGPWSSQDESEGGCYVLIRGQLQRAGAHLIAKTFHCSSAKTAPSPAQNPSRAAAAAISPNSVPPQPAPAHSHWRPRWDYPPTSPRPYPPTTCPSLEVPCCALLCDGRHSLEVLLCAWSALHKHKTSGSHNDPPPGIHATRPATHSPAKPLPLSSHSPSHAHEAPAPGLHHRGRETKRR